MIFRINQNIATMFFVCALVLFFLIKLRFPKGISIASVIIIIISFRIFNSFRKNLFYSIIFFLLFNFLGYGIIQVAQKMLLKRR